MENQTDATNKYDSGLIPVEINDYIHHWETNELLYNIVFERYRIPEDQAKKIVEIIWEIYFKRIPYAKLEQNLIGIVRDENNLHYLLNALQNELLLPIRSYLLTNNPIISSISTEKLPIAIAIQKYPELGEQLITQNRIKLAVFPDPVRPSIKNWLADYSYIIGISNRDPIVRGDYLFKGENGRSLNSADREKLAEILKSFEEKTPLTVNTKTNQVVFLAPTEKRAEKPLSMQPAFASNSNSPVFATDNDRLSAWRKNLPQKESLEKEPEIILPEKISFSSPQTFSTEKVERPASIMQKPKNIYPSGRPIPKNVVNLREE